MCVICDWAIVFYISHSCQSLFRDFNFESNQNSISVPDLPSQGMDAAGTPREATREGPSADGSPALDTLSSRSAASATNLANPASRTGGQVQPPLKATRPLGYPTQVGGSRFMSSLNWYPSRTLCSSGYHATVQVFSTAARATSKHSLGGGGGAAAGVLSSSAPSNGGKLGQVRTWVIYTLFPMECSIPSDLDSVSFNPPPWARSVSCNNSGRTTASCGQWRCIRPGGC